MRNDRGKTANMHHATQNHIERQLRSHLICEHACWTIFTD